MFKPSDLESQPSRQKRRAVGRGRRAEWLARWVLRFSGHRILAKNYKTKVGEIDIVTKKKNIIGFVEVKARPTHAGALEAISRHQQNRIQRAAEHFLAFQPQFKDCDVRFDVAVVTGPLSIRLLFDAWRP